MENETTGDQTPPPAESTDGLSGDSAERRSPEWAGGHKSGSPSGQDADPDDLPEHEVDEETTVAPENS